MQHMKFRMTRDHECIVSGQSLIFGNRRIVYFKNGWWQGWDIYMSEYKYNKLNNYHKFGCPTYILNANLQDNKKSHNGLQNLE